MKDMSPMPSGKFHGSPKESHSFKMPKSSAMTSKDMMMPSIDPGKAAKRVKPNIAGAKFEGGQSNYKPKKMSSYKEE